MALLPTPLVAFVVGVAVVVLLLVYLDLPAFIGLLIAAFTVGLIAPEIPAGEVPATVATTFGEEMAGIGIPILMAAVIGKSMMSSGAADRVVRGFVSLTGRDNAEYALWGSSSLLSIPVFFDNVFYLMAPLARSMRSRIGKNYTLFLVVVGAGAATTHVFVPPTPGPLAVASEIDVNLGTTILIGLAVAIPSALVGGLAYGHWINARLDIPLRDSMDTEGSDLETLSQRETSALPGLFESLLPILLAVVLVGSNTITTTLRESYGELPGWLTSAVPLSALNAIAPATNLLGDPNFALTVAAVVAAVTFLRSRDLGQKMWSDELTDALKNGGNIAAITATGGAFGGMLAAAGVGGYISGALSGLDIGLLVTAWVIAATIRIAQGSATVAMLTTAGIVAPQTAQLAVHPAYLVMAIGAGGNICSWYNDSGFWLVKEIGGLTQSETLKTWTVLTTIISVVGIVTVLVLSSLFPLT